MQREKEQEKKEKQTIFPRENRVVWLPSKYHKNVFSLPYNLSHQRKTLTLILCTT